MSKKVSLVLSGGGARGIAHIGVIEELEKRGYEIVSVAGTSMGALVGGLYVAGGLEEYKNWMYTLDKRKVFQLVDFTLSREGLVKGDRVFKAMKELVPEGNIEDMAIPYAAVAVDLVTKKEIVFREGSLYDAIRASVSIPNVFKPTRNGEMVLVDGGVLNNLPVNRVERIEGSTLMAVYVNAKVPLQKPTQTVEEEEKKQAVYRRKMQEFHDHLPKLPKREREERFSVFNQINASISLMTGKIAQMNLEIYQPDLLINVSRDSAGTYDFYKSEEILENGRYAAQLALDDWESK